jgi:hypothetical protein
LPPDFNNILKSEKIRAFSQILIPFIVHIAETHASFLLCGSARVGKDALFFENIQFFILEEECVSVFSSPF